MHTNAGNILSNSSKAAANDTPSLKNQAITPLILPAVHPYGLATPIPAGNPIQLMGKHNHRRHNQGKKADPTSRPRRGFTITTHGTGNAMRAGDGNTENDDAVNTQDQVSNIIENGNQLEINTAIRVLTQSIRNRTDYSESFTDRTTKRYRDHQRRILNEEEMLQDLLDARDGISADFSDEEEIDDNQQPPSTSAAAAAASSGPSTQSSRQPTVSYAAAAAYGGPSTQQNTGQQQNAAASAAIGVQQNSQQQTNAPMLGINAITSAAAATQNNNKKKKKEWKTVFSKKRK